MASNGSSKEVLGKTEVFENSGLGQNGLDEISVEKAKAQEKIAQELRG